MRIGLDFDNTIIRYDEVFQKAAKERGLLEAGFSGNKQQVRDAIRILQDGELQWQALQGYVYGKGISGAQIFSGAPEFLRRARKEGHTILIVSHKTEYGHYDPDRVNLRMAALGWMEGQGFFSDRDYSIRLSNVHFASSRAEKVSRIAALGCDIFVDDLCEVLADPDFPPSVERILFSQSAEAADGLPYSVCRDWPAIEKVVFDGRG